MFASTNLVIELGAILWVLMGWQFVLAEIVGAFLLIILMWFLIRFFLPQNIEIEIRARMMKQEAQLHCYSDHSQAELAATSQSASGHEHAHHRSATGTEQKNGRWTWVAHSFVTDWSMLWKEILGGFLIAGVLATLVPHDWWQALFLQSGPAVVRLIENALVGPIIAVVSFVCSVGNIPLASLLWAHGISFGGVISFIYADLLVIPILVIYAKYYGVRAAAWITGIFYVAMVLAGIIVDLVFTALGLIPQGPRPPSAIEHAHIIWNYTSWLDLIALIFAAWLLILHFRSRGERNHAQACH
jgi:uncharacterized membrane protein YraQ (UPF0718 family)